MGRSDVSISDLKTAERVTLADDADQIVAVVSAPRIEEEVAAEEEEAETTEEAPEEGKEPEKGEGAKDTE